MVFRAAYGHSSYLLSLKSHSMAISVDDMRVVTWDRGGRLYTVYRDEETWRRGLSGVVLEKRQDPIRSRRLLSAEEAARIVEEGAALARQIQTSIGSPGWRWEQPIEPALEHELVTVLALCGRFDAAAAQADARRFAEVYRPVGILPPDQYLALVVQLTEGCSFNTCTFCDLYHEGYRVKTPDQFRQHVRDVLAYLGESATLRSRGVFLGAANALAVPMARLVPAFEILADDVDGIRRGVFAFVDGFTGHLKTERDYCVLRDLGLRRVYIGLESGHDPLLRFVKKPGTAHAAVETVHAIKTAGVHVGVIVMVGLGGERFAPGHVEDTIAVINAMELGAGDLLYFSDLVEVPGTPYPVIAAREAIAPLSFEACREQQRTIRAGLRFAGDPPQLATYDVREFVY
jgi:hypothetical protein